MTRGTPIHFRRQARYGPRPVEGLTRSQESVVTLLSLSLTAREVSEILGIGVCTVRKTIERAMRRVHVSSTLQLVLWWDRNRNRAA